MSSGQSANDQFSISKLTSTNEDSVKPGPTVSHNGQSSSAQPQLGTGTHLDPNYLLGLRPSPYTSYPHLNSYAMDPAAMGRCYYDAQTYASTFSFDDRYSNPLDFHQSVRRKNATKETTSALKAWLAEHKKNPYPTKGEKIMLAILTRMTLTQVSTWFANARRRLKKENKMTWSPRTCCGKNEEDCRSKKAPADSSGQHNTGHDELDSDEDSDSEICDKHVESGETKIFEENHQDGQKSEKRSLEDEDAPSASKKFKIWSIAETVSTDNKKTTSDHKDGPDSTSTAQSTPYSLVFPPWPRLPSGYPQPPPNFVLRPDLLYHSLMPFTTCSSTLSNSESFSFVKEVKNAKTAEQQQQSPVSSTTCSVSNVP